MNISELFTTAQLTTKIRVIILILINRQKYENIKRTFVDNAGVYILHFVHPEIPPPRNFLQLINQKMQF